MFMVFWRSEGASPKPDECIIFEAVQVCSTLLTFAQDVERNMWLAELPSKRLSVCSKRAKIE